MKRKFIKKEEIENYVSSVESIIYMDSSPVSDITSPPSTVFTAIVGNRTAHDAQGTLYIVRSDSNDTTALLDIDEYSFNALPGDTEIEIVGPLKPEYHHSDSLPSILASAPKEIVDKIKRLKQE